MAEEKLTGFYKYFNSSTVYGRANTSKVTLGATALICLYFYFKPKKQQTKDNSKE
ncbi:PREDICTED: up-regulated during skeletal muscle growth protein 5 [Dinoponera quadriceps]|uniref:Up-regulated during skeletal muscle growth protein 5 n=1 Tax=Dinoponera quadriceps TaxID=609295 RepID=A0A6P3XMH7_DINQU|nr:PREDICTED: up-regulated during skeletal muscle growth protein 5 [Dinoponera quadriceps]